MPGYEHKGRGCSLAPHSWHGAVVQAGTQETAGVVSEITGSASLGKKELASLILSGKQMLKALFFPEFWAKFSFHECLGKS